MPFNPSFTPRAGTWGGPTAASDQLFADNGGNDCPFSNAPGGDALPGASDCLGSSPSYYETLRMVDIDGGGSDEMVARANDGLRVYVFDSTSGSWDSQLATLTALAGAGANIAPGVWGSIRYGNVDGQPGEEVLFVDAQGQLEVWSYASGAWAQLPASPAVSLGTDVLDDASQYATLQVGDVDGDGRGDVVMRGPYGIRTWFYNRRGTGGWERYLPDGFAPWPTAGQTNAYAALTTAAKAGQAIPKTVSEVRAVWTAEDAPQPADLTALQSGPFSLPTVANCTGPVPGTPGYQRCTPPAGSTGFTADDWKTVVNDLLGEIDAAQQVLSFFAQIDEMRTSLFIAEGAELPAIGSDLGLQLASQNQGKFNTQGLFAGLTGIAASIAGAVPGAGPEASAALWVASEVISMVPSASPTASSSTAFQTDYAGLQSKFATIVTDANKAVAAQSQDIRQDAGLLALVAQLRARGTWAMDTIGIASAANQAFAGWVYQGLVPSVLDRYDITNCGQVESGGEPNLCVAPTGPGVIGGGESFIMAGPKFWSYNEMICEPENGELTCTYLTGPPALMRQVWGVPTDGCDYVPGQAKTAWTFGCPAGVDPRSSIGANAWNFSSYIGDPFGETPGEVTAAAARAPSRPAVALGRPPIGRRTGAHARAIVRADTVISPRLHLARATIRLDQLLFEAGGRGELARPRSDRANRPLKIKRRASGGLVARARSRPGLRVLLRRVGRRTRVALTVQVRASSLRTPAACHAWPAAVSRTRPTSSCARACASETATRAASCACATAGAARVTPAATSPGSCPSGRAATRGPAGGLRSPCAARAACSPGARRATSPSCRTAAPTAAAPARRSSPSPSTAAAGARCASTSCAADARAACASRDRCPPTPAGASARPSS